MRDRLRATSGDPTGVDVEVLSDVVRHHRIGPSLDHLLKNAPDADAVAHLRAATRPTVFAQAGRQLPIQLDLKLVAEALDGFPWAVLKGPAVATTVHGGAPREFHDLDVLVSPAAFGDALGALESIGARAMDPDWAGIRAARAGEIAVALPHGTFLDLHWHLVNRPSRRRRFAIDVDAMLDRTRAVALLGTRVPVLDATDQLHHLALHACLSGAWRLLWSYDLRLASAGAEWSELADRARSARTALPVALALARARQVLSAPVPRSALHALVGASPLLAAQGVLTGVRPPQRLVVARRNGAALFTSASSGTLGTLAELARTTASRLPGNATDDQPTPESAPHDPNGRTSYLEWVASSVR